MAIKVGGTTVIDDSRALSNIASVDATTVAALGAAGVGGGGGSIELTAAEALSAGQTVIINSNGQAKGVEKTVGTATAGPSTAAQGGDNKYVDAVYYPNANYSSGGISGQGVFGAIIRYDSSNAIYQFIFSVNPTTGIITAQGDFQIGSATNKGHSLALAYSPTVDRALFFNADAGNGDFFCQGFSYSGLTLSASSELQIAADYIPHYSTNGTINKAALVYDASLNIFVASCDNGTNMLPVYAILLPLGTGAPTLGGSSTVSTSGWDTNYRFPKLATNNQGQFVMLAYDSSGGNTYAVAFTVDPNNSYATTFGSKVQLSNSTQLNDTYSIEYDSVSGKFITTAKSSAGIDMRALTVSSNAITLGTATNLINSTKANDLADGGAGNLGVVISLYSSLAFKPVSVDSNGNITLGSSVTISNATGWDTNRNLMVTSTKGNLASAVSHLSLGNVFYTDTYKTKFYQATSSSSDNFIGVVEGAISSGSTGKVTIIGGLNENQTGLTAGLKYYVNAVGGLSTTETSAYAGVATSSTNLLVKG